MKHDPKQMIDWKQIDTKGIEVQTQRTASAVAIAWSYAMQLMLKAGLALLLFCTVATAAPPKLSINVNRSAAVGTGVTVNVDEPVTLEFSTDAGAKLAVFVVPKINFDSTSDGRKVIFFAKQSVVFLVAAFSQTGEITKSEYLITVSGTPVPVPPGPGPTPPGPQPIIPTSKIGKASYDAAMKVESATRADDAALVAKGMRAAHAKAKAVATMKGTEILLEAVKSFDKLTAFQKNAWKPWGPTMFLLLKAELGDDPARDKAISAVEEMAKGLEAVK